MYNLIFVPEFLKDIDAAFEHISCSLDSPQAAKAMMKEKDGRHNEAERYDLYVPKM